MRNNIISLQKYFSIFTYLLAVLVTIWEKSNTKISSGFCPNCNQLIDIGKQKLKNISPNK